MRVAVIDCGTNTFNLLVVDVNGSMDFKNVFTNKIPVKLGEGAINKGYIAQEPFKRGIDALVKFKSLIESNKVNKTFAFATSAIRDASNGDEFCKKVFNDTGISINVIDGNKEADLIYRGNRLAVKLKKQPSLIMDIGGGSTEFIIGNDEEIFWKKSYQLGAARLLEMFKPSDPISKEEIEKINLYLENQLNDLKNAINKYHPAELIGSSGAFDSIVEMIHGELGIDLVVKSRSEYEVNLNDYHTICKKVVPSTIEERKRIKGLVEMRVDMMVISCLLINFILNKFQLDKIRVSTFSLKEGALAEIMGI